MPKRVDETGEAWPYDAYQGPEAAPAPTWECPGGECVCHSTTGEVTRAKHRIVFFDHAAVRMPGARCRVEENGRLLNLAKPYAGPDGSLDVEPAQTTRTLVVDWAPHDAPEGARYPYRKIYQLAHPRQVEHGVESRLKNLGFSAYPSLRQNICDFQRTYHMKETGRAADVDGVVKRYHDEGLLPPVVKAKSRPDESTPDGSDRAPDQVRALRQGPPDAAGPGDPAPPPPPPDDDPQGDTPPGPTPPGAGGGSQPQGAVAAIQTTKLRIELVRAFALFKEDFDQDDDDLSPPWPESSADGSHTYGTYDAHRLLTDLYPTPDKRLNRWAAGGVEKATVTLSDGTGEPIDQQPTDKDGVAVFDISRFPETSLLICDVAPPDGQLSPTRSAAGPTLTDENTAEPFFYRSFTLMMNLDATGVVVSSASITPSERPRFAKILRVDAGPTTNTVRIDWRPDWIRAGTKKSRAARLLDPQDTPVNPFDHTLPVEGRRTLAPPAIMIHGTATHNFPAISGHILDGGDTGSHYWVDYDGFVVKMVDELYKTNHAGESLWVQRGSSNQYAVGIETMHLDSEYPQEKGKPDPPPLPRRYTKEQYAALIRLCRELQAEYPILQRHVIGHTDPYVIGAQDKVPGKRPVITNATHQARGCPGDYFDWQRLEDAKVALKPFFPIADLPDWNRLKGSHEWAKDLFWFPKAIPERTAGRPTKSEDLRRIKVMLFDIGYSVALTRIDRADITDVFDTPTNKAVRAFQQHHFSGRRRRFKGFGTGSKGAEASWKDAGTLDRETVRAIVEKWWATQDDPV